MSSIYKQYFYSHSSHNSNNFYLSGNTISNCNQINSFIRLESDPDLTPVIVVGVHGRNATPKNCLFINYLIN